MTRLALIVALLSSGFVWAKIDLPDPMPTVDRQTQYLLHLQTEIPTLFEQGAEYDIDFFTLIREQDRLVSVLNMEQNWIRMAEARPPLTEIQISLPNLTRTMDLQFQMEKFSGELRRNRITSQAQDFESYLNQILTGGDANQLVSGMMSLVTADQKREGHRKSTLSEKIEFLRGVAMPTSQFQSKFRPEKAGLDEMPRSWSQAVDWAEQRYRSELLVSNALIQLCREDFGTATCEELFSEENQVWSSVLRRKDLSREQTKALERLRRNIQSQFSSKEFVTTSKSKDIDVVKLTEVPPYIGIFRGLVGGDCSTSTSFPYVYMPGERTYFLYAPDGRLLGYLMGTLVKIAGIRKPLLYVHTISGPHLSRRHVELALYGLRQSAEDLEISDVLIPTKEIAHRNINYVAIHGFLSDLRSPRKVPIHYVDEDIRNDFATHPLTSTAFNSAYDSPQANREAYIMKEAQGDATQIKTAVRPYEPEQIHFDRRPNRSEAVLIALDLLAAENSPSAQNELRDIVADIHANNLQTGQIDYASRRQAAAKILAPFHIRLSNSERLAVSDSLLNTRMDNLRSHYRQLERYFGELDVELTSDLIEKRRSYLFAEGHLRAPDATTVDDPQLRKRTLQFVIYMLKRWAHPLVAYEVISNNPRFFNESEKFMRFVEGLFDGTEPEYRILVGLYENGIDFTQLNLQDLAPKVRDRQASSKKTANRNDDPIDRVVQILDDLGLKDCESPLLTRRRPQ